MRRHSRVLALVMAAVAIATWSVSAAQPPRQPARRPPVRRGAVVFVGGYFYDPFFGPYPWWQRGLFPYYPVFDNRADVRVLVTPKEAGVYVDGFYAGIVDDFNGFFQRLPLTPGGHEIVLYLEGYRTVRQRVYLSPSSTFKIQLAMEVLPRGERAAPPLLAPAIPAPPEGTYLPPRTPPPAPLPPPEASEPASVGTLSILIQPAGAALVIDGEPWVSSNGTRFAVDLVAGPHHVEVSKAGYQTFTTDVQVRESETVRLNVSLSRP